MASERHRSRHALFLLWAGVLALAMHAFAGLAHAPSVRGDGAIEICTAQGVVLVAAAALAPAGPPLPEPAAAMPCCKLCGAGAMPALAAASGLAPVVTRIPLDLPFPVSEPRRALRAAFSPLVPRGPPTRI